MKNAIEIFTMLYNDEITEKQCIEVIHEQEQDHYLMRNRLGNFDEYELMCCLLFKEYKFKVVNQATVEKKLAEKNKQDRIKQLESELARLKGE